LPGPTPPSLATTRRRFRLVLYLGLPAITSVTILAVILKQIYNSPTSALTTEGLDAVVFESVIVLGGALIGALAVAALFDAYQARYAEQSDSLSQTFMREGITAVYRDANDPRLLSALEDAIHTAHDEIFAVGLGLGILHNNRGILVAIAERVNATSNLKVLILTGARSNDGVRARIEEETSWHSAKGINYDPNWVVNFPAEIRSVITVLTDAPKRSRVRVLDASFLPMIGLLKIDERYFYFPYGSPDVRGSESPWIEFVDDAAQNGYYLRFVRRTVAYFKSTAP